MTVLTITTPSSETKVLLKPPMTEAREIKFLSYHKPTWWFKFEKPQENKELGKPSKTIFTIPKGYYTLESLRKEIQKEQYSFEAKPKLKIKSSSEGYYLLSKINVLIDREMQKQLNLLELIYKGEFYNIKSFPNKPLFFFCNIINSHKSYTGFDNYGESKLKLSNLLAVFPSEHYPSLEIEKSRLPLNQLTLRIEDESGEKPQFNESITFSIEIT